MQNVTTMRELDIEQLDEVGGGGASAEWGVSTGTAVTFTVAAAAVASPLVAGALVTGGIIAAGFAIYYALSDDESMTAS